MRNERSPLENPFGNAQQTLQKQLPSGARFHTLTSRDLGYGMMEHRAILPEATLHFGEKVIGTYNRGAWVCNIEGVDYYHTHTTRRRLDIYHYKGVLACAPKK